MHKQTKLGSKIFITAFAFVFLATGAYAGNKRDSIAVNYIREAKMTAPADTVFVSGLVKDAATGQPLVGASIQIEGYSAAISDNKGFFRVGVPTLEAVLSVGADGFQIKQVALKGRNNVTILLYTEPFGSVYDLVNLPLGMRPANQVSYSAVSVQVGDGWRQGSKASVESYLQGKVAGLDVKRNSGTPGDGANLMLRGFNSLYATNQPLIVVDGVPYDNEVYGNNLISEHRYNPISNIDLKDIDNITILKSGTSTYGTKGANGVILITTARAKELATRIDFAAYAGFNSQADNLPLLDASGYRTLISDIMGTDTSLTSKDIQRMPFMNDDPSNPDYFRYHYNTNWQDLILRNSVNQNYYLKVTGGDNIAKYALSLGYMKNDGMQRNTDLTRYQVRFNGDLNLSKKLTAAINLSLSSNQQNSLNQGMASQTNPLYLSWIKPPILPSHVVGDDGKVSPNLADYDIFGFSNPVSLVDHMQGFSKYYRFSGTVKFAYEFNPSLHLQTLVGVTFDKAQEDFFIPQSGVVPDTLDKAVAYNHSGSNLQRFFNLYNDTRLNYDHTFGGAHHLTLNLGARYSNYESEQEFGKGYNSATDEFVSVGMGVASLREIGGAIGKWRWMNGYFNADYDFRQKYFLSFNVAADGSSRFGTHADEGLKISDHSYPVMASISGAWLMSSENFLANAGFIESLKLRASYSQSGNDDIGNYTARQYYISQSLLGMQGVVRGNIGNPALQWEDVAKMNLGLDGSLFDERVSFSLDYYHNKTTKMITLEPINTATGFSYLISNNSAMQTDGLEFSLNGRLVGNSALSWDMGITLASYKNKVLQLPGDEILTQFVDATYQTKVGQAANQFYGYKTDGIYNTAAEAAAAGLLNVRADGSTAAFEAGDVRFVDKNGDGLISDADRQVIGDPNPKLTGGFNNTVTLKRWKLDMLFTFSTGGDLYNYQRARLESMSGFENQTEATVNRWRSDGQVTGMPRASWGDPSGNARFSDRWIEDGSYLRLRTLSLSYQIPVEKSALKYIYVYGTANNLFTFTKYLGYDPEFSATRSVFGQGVDLGLEPLGRTFQLGLRLGF